GDLRESALASSLTTGRAQILRLRLFAPAKDRTKLPPSIQCHPVPRRSTPGPDPSENALERLMLDLGTAFVGNQPIPESSLAGRYGANRVEKRVAWQITGKSSVRRKPSVKQSGGFQRRLQ